MVKEKPLILVMSWGGTKWMYACWILKAMEEFWIKEKIKAIYWVSAWALTAAYWLSWWKAESIVDRFIESELFSVKNIAIPPTKWLLKAGVIERILKKDLKKSFDQLDIPLHVGATDLWKWKMVMFSEGNLIKPVLWSMAVPGLFPPVEHENNMLVDWWVTNNFPIDIARKNHPNANIIWILLSKFKKDQKVKNVINTLQVSYEILLRSHFTPNINEADILFYRDLKSWMVENSEEILHHLFDLGYKDGKASFKSY